MLLRSVNVLRGPNFWSVQHHQLIVLHLDLQPVMSETPEKIPALAAAVQRCLPGI
jgi:cyanophycin synthetase